VADDQTYTPAEAARELGVSDRVVRRVAQVLGVERDRWGYAVWTAADLDRARVELAHRAARKKAGLKQCQSGASPTEQGREEKSGKKSESA